jgi:ketosteroid isomerase-like protein
MLTAVVVLVGCGGGRPTSNVAPKDAEADLQVAQEIMRLEQLWGQALARRDTAFFSQILAPEFLTTGGELVKSKEEVIQELARGSGPLAVPQLRSTRIKVYGDVAVVTGLVTFDAPAGGSSPLTRFSEVWVKRDNRWQAVHGHYNQVGASMAK